MAQGYKHDTMALNELCEQIYHAFGQRAVENFIAERQEANYLSDVTWQECKGCEAEEPFYERACLVCGSN